MIQSNNNPSRSSAQPRISNSTSHERPPVHEVLEKIGAHGIDEDSSPEAKQKVLRRWIETLHGLDSLRTQAERDALVGRDGFSAKLVDAALETRSKRRNTGKDTHSSEEYPDQTLESEVIDLVRRSDDELVWLVASEGKVTLEEEVEAGRPWPADRLPWTAIPAEGAVLEALDRGAEAPIEELAAFIRGQVVLPRPKEEWSVLLAAWCAATYCLDEFAHFPLLFFAGPPERGKTRAAKAVLWPSFRGEYVPSPTEATVFRDRAHHRVTLLLDVEDLTETLDRTGMGDLLLNGFERDGRVPRCNHPDAHPMEQIDYFDAYGATILVTNNAPRSSSPLLSRCIRVPMPEAGAEDVPDPARPEDTAQFRAQLTAWAAQRKADGASLPEVEVSFTGRMADLARPLLQVVLATLPNRVDDVKKLLGQLRVERRRETADSWEARVARALWAAHQSDEVEAGRVYYSDLKRYVNEGRSEEEHLNGRQIGTARKKLGLSKGRGGSAGRTYIRWPGEEQARQLYHRYAPQDENASDALPFPEASLKTGSASSGSSGTPDTTGALGTEPPTEGDQGVQQSLQPQDTGAQEESEPPVHPEGSNGGPENRCNRCDKPVGPTARLCGECKKEESREGVDS